MKKFTIALLAFVLTASMMTGCRRNPDNNGGSVPGDADPYQTTDGILPSDDMIPDGTNNGTNGTNDGQRSRGGMPRNY